MSCEDSHETMVIADQSSHLISDSVKTPSSLNTSNQGVKRSQTRSLKNPSVYHQLTVKWNRLRLSYSMQLVKRDSVSPINVQNVNTVFSPKG